MCLKDLPGRDRAVARVLGQARVGPNTPSILGVVKCLPYQILCSYFHQVEETKKDVNLYKHNKQRTDSYEVEQPKFKNQPTKGH